MAAPTITRQPVDRVVTAGQNAQFRVQHTSAVPATIKWQTRPTAAGAWTDVVNGANYHGATTDRLSVNNAPAGFNGHHFQVVVTNPDGAVTSNTVTLTVNAAAPAPAPAPPAARPAAAPAATPVVPAPPARPTPAPPVPPNAPVTNHHWHRHHHDRRTQVYADAPRNDGGSHTVAIVAIVAMAIVIGALALMAFMFSGENRSNTTVIAAPAAAFQAPTSGPSPHRASTVVTLGDGPNYDPIPPHPAGLTRQECENYYTNRGGEANGRCQ